MSIVINNNFIREYFTTSWKSNHLRILALVQATWVSNLIYLSVKYDFFDYIANGFDTVDELAKQTKINNKIMIRLLKGLQHLELLVEDEGQIQITELGKLLVKTEPGNMAHMSLLWGEEFGNAWSRLSDAVFNGGTGFESFYKQEIFKYFSSFPESASNFNNAMHSVSQLLYPAVINKLPMDNIKKIVDVGGGKGNLIRMIAESHPQVECCLFELANVIDGLKNKDSQNKSVELVKGDFFNEVPFADAHIMSNVLHDWDDEQAAKIINNIYKAQPKNGKLFLLEMAVDHPEEPILARSTDLNMLVFTGGRERSREEFVNLLADCKFELESLTNVKDMTCLLVARRM